MQVLSRLEARLPAAAGSYLLVLRLAEDAALRAGALGEFLLPAGLYVYAGSARGPGGVRARVVRHLRCGGPAHWHIDSLLRQAQVTAVWVRTGKKRLECVWAQGFARQSLFTAPARRFGASDCRCPSHLWHAEAEAAELRQALARLDESPECLWENEREAHGNGEASA